MLGTHGKWPHSASYGWLQAVMISKLLAAAVAAVAQYAAVGQQDGMKRNQRPLGQRRPAADTVIGSGGIALTNGRSCQQDGQP